MRRQPPLPRSRLVQALVAAGASVGQADKNGATPLFAATMQGRALVVEELLHVVLPEAPLPTVVDGLQERDGIDHACSSIDADIAQHHGIPQQEHERGNGGSGHNGFCDLGAISLQLVDHGWDNVVINERKKDNGKGIDYLFGMLIDGIDQRLKVCRTGAESNDSQKDGCQNNFLVSCDF